MSRIRKKKRAGMPDLVRAMTKLRGPNGCPWDHEQTHASLLKYLKEESREVELAVKKKDWVNLKEELGDVLLQVLFHSEIARQDGRFDIHDVFDVLHKKLVRRHPHVFGPAQKGKITSTEVIRRWHIIKAKEKRQKKKK